MPPNALPALRSPAPTPLQRYSGRFSQLFQGELAALMAGSNSERHPRNADRVVRQGNPIRLDLFRSICDRLLLPGSRINGLDHLAELAERAKQGEPGMVLSWHGSNLDAPNLHTLLWRAGRADLFDRLVFIAGRKLDEESATSRALTESFHRVVVTPQATLERLAKEPGQLRKAKQQNLRALRGARNLLAEGRLLFLYPTGTRYRPARPETGRALRQVASYLRLCENFVVINTRGNALEPIDGCPMIDEYAQPAVVQHSISPLIKTAAFRAEVNACATEAGEDPRRALADAVMDAIADL